MLRAGPTGVQRIEPKFATRSNAPAKESSDGGVTGTKSTPAVLSFKTLLGKSAPVAAPATKSGPAKTPLTPSTPMTPGTRVKDEVKEEEEAGGEDSWMPLAPKAKSSSKAATAKRFMLHAPVPKAAQQEEEYPEDDVPEEPAEEAPEEMYEEVAPEEAPEEPPAEAEVAPKAVEEEVVLDNEDWLKAFNAKWDAAMTGGDDEQVKEEPAAEEPAPPPAKRPRIEPQPPGKAPLLSKPSPGKPPLGKPPFGKPPFGKPPFGKPPLGKAVSAFGPKGKAVDPKAARPHLIAKPPLGPPPKHLVPKDDAPNTPANKIKASSKAVAGPSVSDGLSASEVQLREEYPEWASRCNIEAAKPGQPQRVSVAMAEVGLGDEGLTTWCRWMDQRLALAQPLPAIGGRARFRAGTIDFSENEISATSLKLLCAMLEKHAVRAEVLRLTANNIGNEGLRCIAKFLTSSCHAPALELHLSRNKVTGEGVKWLLGCLTMHPAYPIWNNQNERYWPLRLKIDNNKIKAGTGYAILEAACPALQCSVCIGEISGTTNVGCTDELKHNCVVHLVGWAAPEDSTSLPFPAAHARPLFAPPGRGALRAVPSGVEEPLRDEPRVVYEDDDLAVVMKPAGWSCLPQPKGVDPSWGRLKPLARRKQVGTLMMQSSSAPPLQAWLLLHFGPDPNCDAARDQASDRGLAHRLDLDTSGPILVGKTLKGYEHARKQVLAGLLKDYIVLVHGTPSTERGECNAPIDISAYAEEKRVRVDPAGQAATTVWEVIAEYESPEQKDERYTLVHCRVGTLRTHQIRVHLQHLGHPLVGDRIYGSGEPPEFCPRTFLHQYRIGFFNLKGKACVESCTLQTAPDLWSALGRLRKVGGMAMKGCGAPGL